MIHTMKKSWSRNLHNNCKMMRMKVQRKQIQIIINSIVFKTIAKPSNNTTIAKKKILPKMKMTKKHRQQNA